MVNNTKAIFSINGATLNNEKSVIGVTTQIISTGVGSYLGYKYFPMAFGFKDGKLNASSIGGAAIGGIAGYGLNNSFNYLLGHKRNFPLNQYNYDVWKKSFDPNKEFVVVNNDFNKLEFVDKSYESNFPVRITEDAEYFKKAFPRSEYSKSVFDRTLKIAKRDYLPTLSNLFPDVDQSELSKKYLLSSTNFSEYKQSIEYFPTIKLLGESYLANSAKDYSNLRSFDALYPNSLLTKDIAKRIIQNINLSELRDYLTNYKKYLTFTDFPNYVSADKKEYLYEWLLAFNDSSLSKPYKIKYLNFSNSLADFISSSKSLKLNFVNSEYELFKNNKSLTNGETLFNKFNDVSNQFESNLIKQLKQEIISSTLENVTNKYRSLNSTGLKNLSNTLKSNSWLSKNAQNETLSYTINIDTQKALTSIKEFNTEFLAALNDKNESLVRKYLKDGADTRNLNYDQFYFIAQIDPTKKNSEILYQKLTKYDQYASFLRLFPSYAEEFERKVNEWKSSKCILYIDRTEEYDEQHSAFMLFSWTSKKNMPYYRLKIPTQRLNEYEIFELNPTTYEQKSPGLNFTFDTYYALNKYKIENNKKTFIGRVASSETNFGNEKGLDRFIENHFLNNSSCPNGINFKLRYFDALSDDAKMRRNSEEENREQREIANLEREKRREQEEIANNAEKLRNKEIKDFQDFKSRTSFKFLERVKDKGVIFPDFNGSCPCDKYELRKENFWIDDKFDIYQDDKGKWYIYKTGLFAEDIGPYNTSDDLLRYIYKEYFNR